MNLSDAFDYTERKRTKSTALPSVVWRKVARKTPEKATFLGIHPLLLLLCYTSNFPPVEKT